MGRGVLTILSGEAGEGKSRLVGKVIGPVGQANAFEGVIDLVEMKHILRDPTDPANVRYSLVDIPGPYKAQAEQYHQQLCEAASHASFTRRHWPSVKAVRRKYSQRLSCRK